LIAERTFGSHNVFSIASKGLIMKPPLWNDNVSLFVFSYLGSNLDLVSPC
jgi:hypothetical protein